MILLLPILLWFFLFREIFVSKFPLIGDNIQYYYWIHYYLSALAQGEFPLWTPFYYWGSLDNFDMRFLGEFNPFLYLILVLKFLGLPFASAFMIHLGIYHCVGAIGFYFLGRILFKEHLYAYLGFILYLFSSVTFSLFSQLSILYMLVPTIWFFYFLLAFLNERRGAHLLGLSFSSMLLATTYLPFFFLTIALSVLVFTILFYADQIPRIKWDFLKGHSMRLIVFCALSLLLALIPGLKWILDMRLSGTVMNFRHESGEDNNLISVPQAEINFSGSASKVIWQDLFLNLNWGEQSAFYVSIFVYLVILLSFVTRFKRLLGVLFCSSLFVLVLSLADVTPVQAFLYKHVYFFRLFRNYFFFLAYLIPFLILICVFQFKTLIETFSQKRTPRLFWILYISSIHLLAVLFLYQQENVIVSTYLALGLSWGFLVWILFNPHKIFHKMSLIVLSLISLCQPLEYFYYVQQQWPKSNFAQNHLPQLATFNYSFVRPAKEVFEEDIYKGYREHFKEMKDTSGFYTYSFMGSQLVYDMHQNLELNVLQNFTVNKFYIYDHVKFINPEDFKWEEFEGNLKDQKNVAHILSPLILEASVPNDASNALSYAIREETNQFKIKRMRLNSVEIETDFDQPKFLVYTDTYHPNWKAKINGKPTALYRSQYAFKGVWLPAGKNDLIFRFGSIWQEWLNWFLIFYFIFFLVYLMCRYYKDRGDYARI